MSLGTLSFEKLSSVIQKLDSIANAVQDSGLIKEAESLDVITNTLEKEAMKIPAGSDRPAAIFQDSNPKVKDKKDHFPIPDAAHARNALARVNQYSDAPSWYDGSLESLKAAVHRAVHSKFPSIKISE